MLPDDTFANLIAYSPPLDGTEFLNWSTQDTFSPWGDDGQLVFGKPEIDSHGHVHQTTHFTCAVVSQQMILKQFGHNVSESQLVYDATSHGWLTNHGTSTENVGKLLELYGVKNHVHYGADPAWLAAVLAQGHKVIVAVDSGELWGKDWFFEDWFYPNGADHALMVTGLDLSDPSNPKVFVNDPGDPAGAGKSYPLERFLDAWKDSKGMYIATDIAPPDLVSHPVWGANFNPASEIYLDSAFWEKILFNVAGIAGGLMIKALLDNFVIPTSSFGQDFRNLEFLNDLERNQLFTIL